MPRQLLILAVLLFAACGKQAAPETASVATPNPAASADPAPQPDLSGVLGELTQALRKFSAEQRRVPASLDELVSKGYLKSLPALPAGKSFAIEPKELKVVLK